MEKRQKKAYTCFLTYPNGAKSHKRKRFEKSLIERDMLNILDEKEVLNELTETFTLKHGNEILLTCPSSELTEELIKSIKYPTRGIPLTYTKHITALVTDEDKDLLVEIGGGSLSVGLRLLIQQHREKLKRV